MDRKRYIVMIGNALDGRGGMSSVVATYQAGGLFDQCAIIYLPSHADGTHLHKLKTALASLHELAMLLFKGQVALVHIHGASGKSFWRKSLYILLSFALRCPVIFHLHGGGFRGFFRHSPVLAQKAIRRILERCARVIVLSQAWADAAHDISPRIKTSILANPVMLPPSPAHGPLDKRQVCLLFLGRLEMDKGVFDLLEAFARIADSRPWLKLILAGDGDIALIKAKIAELGIQCQVDLPGWVEGSKKLQLLNEASLFVLPSYIEGLPMSMLEAMAYGLPIVVSRVGGIPEAVTEGKDGVLVTPGDIHSLQAEIARLVDDASIRKEMGRLARENIAINFSTDKILRKLELLYAEIYKGSCDTCAS